MHTTSTSEPYFDRLIAMGALMAAYQPIVQLGSR
jgi:hypothetical protein